MDFANSSDSPAAFDYARDTTGQYASGPTQKPKGKGHWQLVKPQPVPVVPPLPDNPTEEDRAAHQEALRAHVQARIDNVTTEWIPDPEPESPEQETTRPPRTEPDSEPYSSPEPLARRPLNLSRHEAQCTVCSHPQRETIEQEFLHWLSPRATANDFDLDVRAIYRHAHAFNLFAARDRNVRFALGHIIERAEHVPTPSAEAVSRAIRFFSYINDDGRWVDPPSHLIVSATRTQAPPLSASHSDNVMDISSSSCPQNHASPRPSKSTHHAAIAPSQLIESNHQSSGYPDTHFQHRLSRKTKTKAKKTARSNRSSKRAL